MRLSFLPLAAGVIAGCGSAESRLNIAVTWDSLPLAGLALTIVPFDLQGLLDSLALEAGERPRFDELEQELRSFRRENQSVVSEIMEEWVRARDSVAQIADRLRGLDHDSDRYRRLYQEFRASYDRLAKRSAGLDRALNKLTSGERNLAERAARAADSLRSWEQHAYSALPETARLKMVAANRQVINLTADDRGVADTVLAPGTWWVIARTRHATNPFLETVWQLSFTARWGLPLKVPLGNFNARTRWRY